MVGDLVFNRRPYSDLFRHWSIADLYRGMAKWKTQEKANVTIMFLHFVTEFTLLFLNLEKSGHMLLKGAKLNILKGLHWVVKVLVAQLCPTLCDPCTIACQAPLAIGFSRQEYWSGLPSPSPGISPTQGSNPCLLHYRQILYCLSHQ